MTTEAPVDGSTPRTDDAQPNAIGLWGEDRFLVRVYGSGDDFAEAYSLIENVRAEDGGEPMVAAELTEGDAARLDALQGALDADTRKVIQPWPAHRDLAFVATPGRRYVGLVLRRADTGEDAVWAKGAWLDPLLPQTQQEFLDSFSFDTRRNLDPETAFLISRQIYAAYADTGETPDPVMAGYVINSFVVYVYKAIELKRPIHDTFEKYRAYAFRALEQLSEDELGVRHDKIHVYASIQTVLWHYHIIDGDYAAAYAAALGVFDMYKDVVHRREEAQPPGSPEIKFPVNRAFNYAISILVLAVMLASQKKPKSTIRIGRTNIDVFRRAVQTGTKNVTWYAELTVSHAAAAACLNLADRVEKGTTPLDHDFLLELIWNAPRIKTPEFKSALSQMIRTMAAKSRSFPVADEPTVVTARRGVVTPTPNVHKAATIEADLAYTTVPPERVQLRLQMADGYQVVEAPAETLTVDAENKVLQVRYPVGADHAPFASVRIFTQTGQDRFAEVDYDEEGYWLSSLFFNSKRAFERGYYVRRRRGKDNPTLLFAAEQLAAHYDKAIAHRAVVAVVYAYRALEEWDVFRCQKALENIDAMINHKRLMALPATPHIRQDPRHLVQSMLMARWHLAVALLDETELLKTVVDAAFYGEGHVTPGILHSYNSVRMSMIAGFLLRKYGRTEDAVAIAHAAERLFVRSSANEKISPNKEWGMLDFEVEHTREVVERQLRWVQTWAEGGDVGEEQDEVVLKATRLLGEGSREKLRHNFGRLVGRIAKASEPQSIALPQVSGVLGVTVLTEA